MTGLPGGQPAFPVVLGEPLRVDPDVGIVEPVRVKNKAQPDTGRKEVEILTAMVLVAGRSDRVAAADPTNPRWLVDALLARLDVLSEDRRLLVLGHGAAWILA